MFYGRPCNFCIGLIKSSCILHWQDQWSSRRLNKAHIHYKLTQHTHKTHVCVWSDFNLEECEHRSLIQSRIMYVLWQTMQFLHRINKVVLYLALTGKVIALKFNLRYNNNNKHIDDHTKWHNTPTSTSLQQHNHSIYLKMKNMRKQNSGASDFAQCITRSVSMCCTSSRTHY